MPYIDELLEMVETGVSRDAKLNAIIVCPWEILSVKVFSLATYVLHAEYGTVRSHWWDTIPGEADPHQEKPLRLGNAR